MTLMAITIARFTYPRFRLCDSSMKDRLPSHLDASKRGYLTDISTSFAQSGQKLSLFTY
jgi:hypothetical protein